MSMDGVQIIGLYLSHVRPSLNTSLVPRKWCGYETRLQVWSFPPQLLRGMTLTMVLDLLVLRFIRYGKRMTAF